MLSIRGSNVSVQMNRFNRVAVRPWERTSSLGSRRRLAPIVILECYLSFTVFVFVFGPWPWPVQNPVTLYSYLFLAQAALLFGYLSRMGTESPKISYIGS